MSKKKLFGIPCEDLWLKSQRSATISVDIVLFWNERPGFLWRAPF